MLLTLLCLFLFLPGIANLPPVDRDEARYAQATRQMLETGDFIDIRFQNEARNKKPAGIYWLQAASVAALSDAASNAIWPYRLPSVVGAIAAVLLTFALGARLVGRQAALLGAALLAASVTVIYQAHLATTDTTLLATSVAAQGALAEVYRRYRRGERAGWAWALLFWGAQGVSVLVKGPVVPLLSMLTIVSLSAADRDLRWLAGLRGHWGVPLLLIITMPWLIAISVATGGAFLRDSIGHDFAGKIAGAQESHGAWPGVYLLLLPVSFWPGSLFMGSTFLCAWRGRREPAMRFLIAWGVPFWVVLELVPTKLPHYLLPAYPALALAAGQALVTLEGISARWRWLDGIVRVVWLVAALGLAAALVILPLRLGDGWSLAGIAIAVILLALGLWLFAQAWTRTTPALPLAAILLSILVLTPTLALIMPRLNQAWLSRAAAEMVARHGLPPGVPVASVGYSEPSLVFMLGTATRLVSADKAAQEMTTARGAVALVEGREDPAFRQALAKHGWEPRKIDAVAGIDYSNGRRMVLTLYAGEPGE